METIIIPIVTGLVQAFKMAGLTSKYAPITAIVLAVVIGYFTGVDALTGIIYGLSSAGLYSGVKATVK